MSAIGLTTNLLRWYGDCYAAVSCEIGRYFFPDSQIFLEIQLPATQDPRDHSIFLIQLPATQDPRDPPKVGLKAWCTNLILYHAKLGTVQSGFPGDRRQLRQFWNVG